MNFLNKEYTKYNIANKSWKNGLFTGLKVLLIFILFQPFGLQNKDPKLKISLYLVYSFLAFIYSISTFWIIRKFPKSVHSWTIKNELIVFIPRMIILTFVTHLSTCWISGDMPFNLHWYIKLFYYGSSLFFVVSILEFYYYNTKSTDKRIENLSSQIEQFSQKIIKAEKSSSKEMVLISLENGTIEINRNKLVLIKSSGNYLELFLLENENQVNKLMKRGRIHQVENDLNNYLEFFRCHRAFIINLKQVKRLIGNSKNARLLIYSDIEEIPVSRSYFKTLKEQLEKIIVQ